MKTNPTAVDVLCVGHACYDLIYSVAKHPESDEKIFAEAFMGCGGGPAANAAVAVSRLGFSSAFAGYLGQDMYGEMHNRELLKHHIDTHLIVRDNAPTPISTVLVKPDGQRALINFKGSTRLLSADSLDFSTIKTKAVLFDGHEPHLSLALVELTRQQGIATVLDAGSLHEGTSKLYSQVDYLVASEKFALQFAGDIETAITRLAAQSPAVVITLGEKGLIWRRGSEAGSLPAFPVKAIDTTGAGDAFHGAFAAAVAADMEWKDILVFSSAAGSLCCRKTGARTGLPWQQELAEFLTHLKLKEIKLKL